MLCLISSYFYGWLAAFGTPDPIKDPIEYGCQIGFELFFFISLIFNFFIEFEIDGQVQPIRDLQRIAVNYIKGYFIFDLIPCIPFHYLPLEGDEKLFYVFKILRIFTGIEFIDVSAMLSWISNYNIKVRLKKLIEEDEVKANDISSDHTYLSTVLVIGYVLKLSKIVFIIMTITYFLGMIWYIISSELRYATLEFYENADPNIHNVETFV